jgi:hypothetical protein
LELILNSGTTLLTWKDSIASNTIDRFAGSARFSMRNKGINWMNTTTGKIRCPWPMIVKAKNTHFSIRNIYVSAVQKLIYDLIYPFV